MIKRFRTQYQSNTDPFCDQIKIQQFLDLDFISQNDAQAIRHHRHEAWQIWVVLDGNAIVDLNGTLVDGRPGDLFLIKANDPHGLWTKDNASCRIFDIKFQIESGFLNGALDEVSSTRIREKSENTHLAEKILFELGDRKPGWQTLVELYLIELTVRTLRKLVLGKVSEESPQQPLDRKLYHHFVVSQVKVYIESNFQRELSVNDLALQVHLNPKYLSHIFKKVTGLPISQYLTEVRLKRAKELLLNSHLSIKEIALEVGYTDTSYFDRVFKKFERTSPCLYRASTG